VPRIDPLGVDLESSAVERDGILEATPRFAHGPQIVQRTRIVRGERERPLVAARGAVEVALFFQNIAKVDVCTRIARIDRDGLFDEPRPFGGAPELVQRHTQVVKCVDMVGHDFEDPAVDLRRLLRHAPLMKPQGDSQGVAELDRPIVVSG
jgi:hypothetical protein